jgi:N-methylhydantoinase B
VQIGASAIVRTGGGGGWGNPLEREPERVRHDVREELISREAARELYGVVVGDDLTLDAAATAQLRRDKSKR